MAGCYSILLMGAMPMLQIVKKFQVLIAYRKTLVYVDQRLSPVTPSINNNLSV